MTINPKNEMIKINELLLLHQKTKVILTKKIDALLIVLDTDEAKTKLQQQQIEKVIDKAKEMQNSKPPMLGSLKQLITYG